jgi:hypothetical protein
MALMDSLVRWICFLIKIISERFTDWQKRQRHTEIQSIYISPNILFFFQDKNQFLLSLLARRGFL